MLKKTKIITNIYWIVSSTYTVSYTDRCTSCTISIDNPCGGRHWTIGKRGGGLCQERDYNTLSSFPPDKPQVSIQS